MRALPPTDQARQDATPTATTGPNPAHQRDGGGCTSATPPTPGGRVTTDPADTTGGPTGGHAEREAAMLRPRDKPFPGPPADHTSGRPAPDTKSDAGPTQGPLVPQPRSGLPTAQPTSTTTAPSTMADNGYGDAGGCEESYWDRYLNFGKFDDRTFQAFIDT